MAKNDKTNISIKDVNEENVSEQLKNANTFSKEVVETAKKNKEEAEQKRLADEFQNISDKATYINLRLVLYCKMFKAASEAAKDIRNKSLDLLKQVEDGKMTSTQYNNELEKLAKDLAKKVDDVQEDNRNDRNELRKKFPCGDWWSWDQFFSKITASIRRIADAATER